jgi:hypothetical protein
MSKNNAWAPLYKLAQWCTIAMIGIIPVQVAIYVISPPPSTVEGFYSLFRESWLMGLLSLDLLYIINTVILIPIYIALILSLFETSKSAVSVAAIFGLIGLAAYFPSNVSFEIMNLSSKYFAAESISQKQIILAAGEAAMARYTGTTFDVYYILNAIVLLTISFVMLKSKIYSRATALSGLVSGVLMSIPSTFGVIGLVFSLISLVPWIVFSVLLVFSFKSMSISHTNSITEAMGLTG